LGALEYNLARAKIEDKSSKRRGKDEKREVNGRDASPPPLPLPQCSATLIRMETGSLSKVTN